MCHFAGELVITFILRETCFCNNSKIISVSLGVDFIISFMVVYLLNFNYNGILIMVFANLLVYVKERRAQFILMVLAIGCFLIADYNLLSIGYHLYSIDVYIQYYTAVTQQYWLGIYNILVSLNIVLFVAYCVNLIFAQRGTIDEVNSLYEELEEVNNQIQEYALMSEKMAETRERNRLAREIHDTLGHTLTGISAGIDACIATIDASPELTKSSWR